MRKWKIEINVEDQHAAIHMLIALVEQFGQAEMKSKTVGHLLMKTRDGSMRVNSSCHGDINVTEQMFKEIGQDPDFYDMATEDTLHCDTEPIYNGIMEYCKNKNIKTYGTIEKLEIRFKESESVKAEE